MLLLPVVSVGAIHQDATAVNLAGTTATEPKGYAKRQPAHDSTAGKPARATTCGSIQSPQTRRERAWQILESACASDKTTDRATATLVLGLIPNNAKSARLAEKALTDDKAEVRAAAAAALGEMKSRASIPKLRAAFDDLDPLVVIAAAHSLDLMHDSSAYEVYYEVLNGERKAGKGLVSSQASLFHDPKKVALLGFEEGLGFIPFAGIGWGLSRRSPRMTLLRSAQPPPRCGQRP